MHEVQPNGRRTQYTHTMYTFKKKLDHGGLILNIVCTLMDMDVLVCLSIHSCFNISRVCIVEGEGGVF